MSSSTTTAGWPTPRSPMTSSVSPPPPCCGEGPPGWPTPARTPAARLPTTAVARGPAAPAGLARAPAWFAARGVTARRVLTDNGGCYRSHAWATACTELGITPKRTRPYRPQTNGKVERFHRTMTSEWAFAQLFTSEADRRAAFPGWLHAYNHHRPHTGIGGHPPISRLTNLPGQYS